VIKLIALGVLGYAAYRYVQAQGSREREGSPAVAGGPLSDHAAVQSRADVPPADDPYAGGGKR
jgi:hypothetical protein